MCVLEQFGEWSQGSRRHDIDGPSPRLGNILDSGIVDDPGYAQDADGLAEKRGFFGIGFDEINATAGLVGEGAAQDQTGKAAAAAEVDPGLGRRCQWQQLQ